MSFRNKNKNQNPNQEYSPGSNAAITNTTMAVAAITIQDFNKKYDGRDNSAATIPSPKTTTRRRRATKVGLNDTLRRIRYLITEGRSNLEIQEILQLEERTFYRYMNKIHKIDQAIFVEQEKYAVITQIQVFKDRILKAYRWFDSTADNESISPQIRMDAKRFTTDLSLALMKLELEGRKFLEVHGLLKKTAG
jgi:DNA-binding CsgD family transcriptional regulator